MKFVRVMVSHTQNRVVAVMVQDAPFDRARMTIEGEECETYDLGAVQDQSWTTLDGKQCAPCRHILERLETEALVVERIVDVPCTLEGIRARVRARGPTGLPVTVRAWLAATLPEDEVRALGIARGIPVSALKAVEAARSTGDPQGGARQAFYERLAHQQAVRRAASALAKRTAKARRAIADPPKLGPDAVAPQGGANGGQHRLR